MTAAARLFAFVASLTLATLLTIPSFAAHGPFTGPQGLADGPGIWMNLWSRPAAAEMDGYFANLRNHGIRNLYIQVGRSNTESIVRPDEVGTLIDYCHKYGVRAIAWNFAQLFDPKADAAKMIEAAEYRSPHGEGFDGLAGNMEVNLAAWKVTQYSEAIRQRIGKNYPMVAVVFSPLNKAPQAQYTPWKVLGKYWDVVAPMTYWSGKYKKFEAYNYTVDTVKQVRSLIGRSDVEIHPIGDGMEAPVSDIPKFMKGCRDAEAACASLYPQHKMTPAQMEMISHYADYFPNNSRFRIAAYKELRRTGAICEPPKLDPAQAICRGDLYKLVVKQLFPNITGELTPVEAFQSLMRAGLMPGVVDLETLETTLAEPATTREAYALVADIVEMSAQPRHPAAKKRHTGGWLFQSARAETHPVKTASADTLNYVDAAQMVLQARAGL
jgi:hypothetical protein